MRIYQDRGDAGRRLAERLAKVRLRDPIVLGLARGGIIVAAEVASALGAPLDVWVVKKITVPGNDEVGIGAVAEGGEVFIDDSLSCAIGFDDHSLPDAIADKTREVSRRVALLRGARPRPNLFGREVIIVDDGVANGVTARAAVRDVKNALAGRVIFATPVGSPDAMVRIAEDADAVVCLAPLGWQGAVGAHYVDFRQVSDVEVKAFLELSRAPTLVVH